MHGGGGRGVAILVQNSTPRLSGYNAITTTKNGLGRCSNTIFPAYGFNLPLVTAGAYGPPAKTKQQPPYTAAREKIPERNKRKEMTTIAAGDINISTWKKGYCTWVETEELWGSSNPNTPTYQTGSTNDARLMALGYYFSWGAAAAGSCG